MPRACSCNKTQGAHTHRVHNLTEDIERVCRNAINMGDDISRPQPGSLSWVRRAHKLDADATMLAAELADDHAQALAQVRHHSGYHFLVGWELVEWHIRNLHFRVRALTQVAANVLMPSQAQVAVHTRIRRL